MLNKSASICDPRKLSDEAFAAVKANPTAMQNALAEYDAAIDQAAREDQVGTPEEYVTQYLKDNGLLARKGPPGLASRPRP